MYCVCVVVSASSLGDKGQWEKARRRLAYAQAWNIAALMIGITIILITIFCTTLQITPSNT